MVQAVNYSAIMSKQSAKTHNITNGKRLGWCESINLYNFFSLSMCFPIRHGKRLGETLKLPRLSRVSGASRSRPASRKLQRLVSVSSRTKFWTSRSRRHGSRVSSQLIRSRAHPCSVVHVIINNVTHTPQNCWKQNRAHDDKLEYFRQILTNFCNFWSWFYLWYNKCHWL